MPSARSFRNLTAPSAPPPGTGSLSGFVFLDYNRNGILDDGEALSGVVVELRGTDDFGNTVVLTATTAADGSYSFTGLRAGTYSLLEGQPGGGLTDGEDFVGTVDGSYVGDVTNDFLFGIRLEDGQSGINYNFSEWRDRT